MQLGDFLKGRAGYSGPWNCSTMPADWCIAQGHPDFAARWRNITDAAECDAIQRDHGLLALWDQGIGDALPVIDEPAAGDIAVIECMGIQAGAIFTGERWAVQGFRCVHFLASEQVAVIKTWRP